MNAEQIARQLGGKRAGRQFKCRCVAHDDHDPSMIVFDGRESVQVRCLSGCDPRDIIAELRRRGLWEPGERTNEYASHIRPQIPKENNSELALRIWADAVDCRGSHAESYLNARGLDLPPSPALRFHPRCPFGGERVPALVVLMCDVVTGRPCAIQRLRLDIATNRKVDAKMLGPAGGAAMMLTSWGDTFSDCLSFCPALGVCEGCETGIALINAGYAPIWALGSAGAIARLPVLFGVGQLVICADNDKNMVGLQAAMDCKLRWNATTHQSATIWMPRETNRDFADQLGGSHGGQTTAA